MLNTAPGFVASKFVPNLIPAWVDDEFVKELRKVYPSTVGSTADSSVPEKGT